MSVAPADIKGFPSGEFAAIADLTVQDCIDEAVRELNPSAFGSRYDDATKYLAAHLLVRLIAGAAAPAGPVIERHAGPVGTSYATPSGVSANETLATTFYGRRFLEIRQQCACGPWVL